MKVSEYIDKVNTRYKSGITTEHSFRGDLQNLLETLLPNLLVTNEPTRIKCGAPDYILTLKDIPVGYIEAKDLGADLNHKNYVEQFSRYKASLSNLIITNYLDFQLFKDGVLITTFSIGEIKGNGVIGKESEYSLFESQIVDFSTTIGQTIKSSQKLAEMMAGKAKMLAQVINKALDSDDESMANSSIKEQFNGFKEILINDIDHKAFSDLYAQTIAYGMFAARLHDPTLPTFSRSEAAELIPKSNPFLRKLFQYIAGFDLDERIVWIVDALADIFRATDVAALLNNFGKSTQQNDPIIHFYETFLSEYDPKLRKARGVWYTPEPVVKFIVRAVDDVLKTDFGLSFECFASAINCTLPNFCSIYYDVERYFGSIGSYFNMIPIKGTYSFNPPYQYDIINNGIERMISHLDNTSDELTFIITIPIWDIEGKEYMANNMTENNNNVIKYEDFNIMSIIKQSKYFKGLRMISKDNFTYFDHNFHLFKNKTIQNTYVILMSNGSASIDIINNYDFHNYE